MARNGPDKSRRECITVMELADMFPDGGSHPPMLARAHGAARAARERIAAALEDGAHAAPPRSQISHA